MQNPWWLTEVAPWFSAAMLLQTLWCYAFRPWVSKAHLEWLPALLLGLTGVCLYGAHGVLVQAATEDELTPLSYILAFLPIALHFGWMSAATLVNVNGFVASAVHNPKTKVSEI